MTEQHARLGPSNLRWPHCPGSVREESAYPDIPGTAAIDGTGSHLLLELCLTNNVRAETYDGQIIGVNHPDNPNGWLVGPERVERVQMCLDYVERRVKELKEQFPDAQVTVKSESRANPGGMFGRTDWWGTCDITIAVVSGFTCLFMEVVDYKDGRGWVDVRNNTQLYSYLIGQLRPFIASGPELVRPIRVQGAPKSRMTIVQPKTHPPVRNCDAEPAEIVQKAEELSYAAWLTDQPDAPLIPDNKGGKGYCRWCKHKPNCTAESERSMNTVISMSNDVIATDGSSLFELVGQSLDKVTELPSEKLAELADARAGFDAIFAKVEEEIERRITEGGEQVPGYEMRPGNSRNVWNANEETIAKALRGRKLKKDEIYPPKLISPAQVMKHPKLTPEQRKRIQEELITTVAGNLKLTKVARDRQEKPSVESMFSDVAQKDVAQSQTNEVSSYPSLFEETPAVKEEVSFF